MQQCKEKYVLNNSAENVFSNVNLFRNNYSIVLTNCFVIQVQSTVLKLKVDEIIIMRCLKPFF